MGKGSETVSLEVSGFAGNEVRNIATKIMFVSIEYKEGSIASWTIAEL